MEIFEQDGCDLHIGLTYEEIMTIPYNMRKPSKVVCEFMMLGNNAEIKLLSKLSCVEDFVSKHDSDYYIVHKISSEGVQSEKSEKQHRDWCAWKMNPSVGNEDTFCNCDAGHKD